MQVVSMALLAMSFYICAGVAACIALASYFAAPLAYVNAAVIGSMLYIQVLTIPLTLNWSRTLYRPVLHRLFGYALFTCVIYAIEYSFAGIQIDGRVSHSFLDSLYFSFTTWTTLGYGDASSARVLRLASGLEAFTGLLTISVLTSMVWLYCSERLRSKTADALSEDWVVRFDHNLGLFRETESAEVAAKRAARTAKVHLNACRKCGATPVIERYWDGAGRITPVPKFAAACECGEHSEIAPHVFLAARQWNRR